MDLNQRIDEILKNSVPLKHSKYQIVNFIVNKEPNNVAKLWQIVRELEARKKNVTNIDLEIEEIKDQIALSELEFNKPPYSYPTWNTYDNHTSIDEERYKVEEKAIKRRILDRQILVKNKAIAELVQKKTDILDECSIFVECYENISKNQQFISPNDDVAQGKYWDDKITNDMSLRQLLGMPIDLEFCKTILSMPSDAKVRKQLVNILNSVQQQLLELKEQNNTKNK